MHSPQQRLLDKIEARRVEYCDLRAEQAEYTKSLKVAVGDTIELRPGYGMPEHRNKRYTVTKVRPDNWVLASVGHHLVVYPFYMIRVVSKASFFKGK